jgi:hypothetical protein
MEPGFFKCSNRLSVHRQCKQLIATSFTLYLALQATTYWWSEQWMGNWRMALGRNRKNKFNLDMCQIPWELNSQWITRNYYEFTTWRVFCMLIPWQLKFWNIKLRIAEPLFLINKYSAKKCQTGRVDMVHSTLSASASQSGFRLVLLYFG